MRRNPLYVFEDRNSRGIYDVPLEATIQINESNAFGVPKIIQLLSKTGFTPNTTIGELLDNFPDNYIDLNEYTEIPSELEKIKEGNKIGWRILGRNPDFYGDIGNNSIDFSYIDYLSNPLSEYGATGTNSFTIGYKTTASGFISFASGIETIANNKGMSAFGLFNKGNSQYNIFEIGCGRGIGDRKNALEITSAGQILAPEMGIIDIEAAGEKSIVTKEYSDNNLDAKLDIAGGTITGDLVIEGTPLGNYSLINQRKSLFMEEVKLEKTLKIGRNTSSDSQIIFKDINDNNQPSIEWNISEQEFLINTPLSVRNVIWHSGNDGIGSQLDAGLFGGKEPQDYVFFDDYQLALYGKFDKTGGDISGDVTILADLTVSGLVSINNLSLGGNLTIGNDITARNIRATQNMLVSGELYAPVMMSSSSFRENVEFQKELAINGTLVVNPNIDNNSIIIFRDANNYNKLITLGWDSTVSELYIKFPTTDEDYRIWHEKNFVPSDKFDKAGGNITGNIQAEGNLYVDGNLKVDGDLTVGGKIVFENLPTIDPGVPGQVYTDGTGNLKISL